MKFAKTAGTVPPRESVRLGVVGGPKVPSINNPSSKNRFLPSFAKPRSDWFLGCTRTSRANRVHPALAPVLKETISKFD